MIGSASPPVAMTSHAPSSATNRSTSPSTWRAEAVDHARLDRLGRRLADDVLRLGELDPPQAGGAAEQRVHRDLDAGEDRAAEVLALVADRFDRVAVPKSTTIDGPP